ncbi:MAG: cytochrome c biogenesis protein ResB [bacterium]|nr:cytochrome c biogenesis protein ResB [bacterium]
MENDKLTDGNKDEGNPDESYGLIDLFLQALIEIPRLMRSLKFAIWVIVILAIFTLIGTILPQLHLSNDPIEFGRIYANLFHVDASDGVNSFKEFLYNTFIVRLELYDIFESGLYFTLMAVLAISSLLCAWDRFFVSRRLLKLIRPKIGSDSIMKMKHSGSGSVAGEIEPVSAMVRKAVGKRGFQIFDEVGEDGTTWFFVRKNSFFHIVSVIFHASLALILVGGIIGDNRIAGYDGVMALQEGEMRSIANEKHLEELASQNNTRYEPQSNASIVLVEYWNVYRERDFPGIDPETGFPVDYHGMPSDYMSHLQIVKPDPDGNSQVLMDKTIEVNRPLRYMGVSYFQSSVNAKLSFSVYGEDQRRTQLETYMDQPMEIPQLGIVVTVTSADFVGGVYESNDGTQTDLPFTVRLVDYGSSEMGGPILVGYVSEGMPITVGGVEISLDSVTEYTILQYVHDPGLIFAYIGGLLLIIGLTVALYFPYRMGRISLVPSGKGVKYAVGGNWSGFPEIIGAILKSSETMETKK